MKADLEDLKMELWLRLRNNSEIKWETKDKKQIPIKDMTTSHLINAIALLEKKSVMEMEDAYFDADLENAGDRI